MRNSDGPLTKRHATRIDFSREFFQLSRARKSVQDEASRRIRLCNALGDQPDHQTIRHEVAALHDRRRLSPDRGSLRYSRAQHVTRRELWDPKCLRRPDRLRSLPRARRSQEDKPRSSVKVNFEWLCGPVAHVRSHCPTNPVRILDAGLLHGLHPHVDGMSAVSMGSR